MKVLITEEIAKEGLEKLAKVGYEAVQKKLTQEELVKEIVDYDAIIVRSATKITPEVIEAGKNLKIIGRAGTGFDNIDVEATTKKGIVVKVAPGGNTNAVAELTISLMIALSRNTFQSWQSLKNKVWRKKEYQGSELYNKTLGIIGCGRIGKKVAEIAGQGFKMKVISYDIAPTENPIITFVDLDTLLTLADYVTLHLPQQKIPIIGREELKKIKKTAYLINTSRGENVDEEALKEALREKWIAGAALDVYQQEGKEGEVFENELFELENFIGISHLGASTQEAQKETGIEIAEVVAGYLRDGDWKGAINYFGGAVGFVGELEPTYNLFVLHENKAGMFAKITGVFGKHNINLLGLSIGTSMDKLWQLTIPKAQQKIPSEVIEEIKKLEGIERISY